MTRLLLTLSLLLLAAPAFAQGTLSIPYTAEAQAAMQREFDNFRASLPPIDTGEVDAEGNPILGPDPGPYANLAQFARALFNDRVVGPAIDAMRADREATAGVREKYLGLSDADKARVEALIDSLVGQ